MHHRTLKQLEDGLSWILASPRESGPLRWIVRRPGVGEREVLSCGHLTLEEGLAGDNWKVRGSRSTADGFSHPDRQLNMMNVRVIELLAGTEDRWAVAGDQLYVDLDLSAANLPPGTRLGLGSAVIEVTAEPHTGCRKFVDRFGLDAMKFVNSDRGRAWNLRGINARLVQAGEVRVGDVVNKIG